MAFDSKMTIPPTTPGEDEAADKAIAALDHIGDASDLIGAPLEVLISKLTDFADVSALYEQAKYAFLQHRARLWTRLEYSVCQKTSCLLFYKRNDWVKQPKTDWVECDIGSDKNVGWYWGRDDALANVPACIQAHEKKEFSQFAPP